jgi:hypothetical protein
MMDKYISSRAARTVFKVPVREQKKISHTMTRYSKQTRLSVNMAEVGAYSFSKLEKTVEDNLISRTEISRNYSTMKAALDYIPGMK